MINIKPKFKKVKYQLNIKLSTDNKKFLYFYNKFLTHHDGDSGIDLFNEEILVKSFLVGTIDFKINCEMIDIKKNEYCSYILVPRSSFGNTFFQLTNSIGIIDAGYRGNIMAKIRNLNPSQLEKLNEGSFFQIVAPDLEPIKINIVNELSLTSRNDGAFGSTKNLNNIPLLDNNDKYILYFDGCSKGNSGNSGAGACIYKGMQEIWNKSVYIGNATNNRAEYEGLLIGLLGALELNIKNIIVKGDSKLIINQLSDKYKIQSNNLIDIYTNIKNLIKKFETITFIHIKRNNNIRADELANNALNNI